MSTAATSAAQPLRRRSQRILVCAASVVALAAFGCTSTVTPPRDPAEPVTVYLATDERHVGLLLPREGRMLVEYGYGDWDWYAMECDAWYDAFDTVLWPTQGTLAKRELAVGDGDGLRREFPWITFAALSVPGARARELLRDLDGAFASHLDQLHHSDRYGMDFVPCDDGYWFAYNCNDAVACWLRRLDCAVSWVPIRLGLAVADR